jgi:hypothetical protein
MAEQFDLDAILRANPQIDQEEFDRLREALRKRQPPEPPTKRQNVTSPFGGRRVAVRENTKQDPRTVRLRRSI